MPLIAGEYAYYFDLGEFGSQMPETLVELIEPHADGTWTVQHPVGYRLIKPADSLISIYDHDRMLPWGNKAKEIEIRNRRRFADWRVGRGGYSIASNNRSNRRNRRSNRRNRRSTRRNRRN